MDAALLTSRGRHALACAAFLIAVASTLAAGTAAHAAPRLDQAFGKGGYVTPRVFPHGRRLQTARGVALQSDGKVIVPMTLPFKYGHRSRRPVIRLNADGTRDRTYGRKGVAWVRAGGAPYITLLGVKTLPGDGSLVWGSYRFTELGRYSEYEGFFVAKLDANGVQDKQFGTNGAKRFSTQIAGNDTDLVDVSPAPDGGVFATYNTYSLTRERDTLRIVRLSPDGAVDRTFAREGTKSLSRDFKVDLSGFAVAGRYAYVLLSGGGKCSISRYDLTGQVGLDPGYGIGGTALAGERGQNVEMRSCIGISVSESGASLVYGSYLENGGSETAYVRRISPIGSPDPGFGSSGMVSIKSLNIATQAVELPGGGVLVAGGCGRYNGCVAVRDAAGSPVPAFINSGTLDVGRNVSVPALAANSAAAVALLLDQDSEKYALSTIMRLTP